jgi:hypothetical protein
MSLGQWEKSFKEALDQRASAQSGLEMATAELAKQEIAYNNQKAIVSGIEDKMLDLRVRLSDIDKDIRASQGAVLDKLYAIEDEQERLIRQAEKWSQIISDINEQEALIASQPRVAQPWELPAAPVINTMPAFESLKTSDKQTGVTNNFNISELVVREDADVQRIARELYIMQQRGVRTGG